jgi:(S)-ureidoglycine aminohydrolase
MRAIFFTVAVFGCLLAQAQRDSVRSKVYEWKNLLVDKDSSSYRVQFADGPTATLAELEIHATELDPGKMPHPPHTHPDVEELIIVKEGNLKVTIKGHTTIIGAGGVALALPGEEHSFENTGKVLTTYYVLRFKSGSAINAERGNQSGGSFIGDWDNWPLEENDKGERRAVFDRFTAMFQKMELHVTTLNEGQMSHNPHKHPQEEILLIRKGNGQVQIGDAVYPTTAGDLVFFSSGVRHNIKNAGKGQLEYFALQWQ